jgi:uncharacterized protein (UPF0333 family)
MKKIVILSQNKGQSTVEYVLLLGVVLMIVIGIFRSDAFNRIFGENSAVFEEYRKIMEHNYRHAFFGSSATPRTNSARKQTTHESYITGSETHFFSPRSYGR